MSNPVSVVITCYNLEAYIADAIDSVLRQSYSGPIELVVVDDCSTDASAEIVRSYRGVRYIRTDRNGGVLLATIAGIEAASYDLIHFLDGDDIWQPSKVSKATSHFQAHPSLALLTHDLEYVGANGARLPRQTVVERVMAAKSPTRYGEAVREGILHHDSYVWLGSALSIRRSAAKMPDFIAWARSLSSPEHTYQDWPLAFWIAALPNVDLGYLPEKLFLYRLHNLNHSGDATTSAKAVRNLRRSINTIRAMRDIAVDRRLQPSIIKGLTRQMHFYEYLLDLNSGKRIRAASKFFGNVPHMAHRRIILKELVRLFGVQVLGPDRFARIKKDVRFA